jgi:aminodeoxychorismate synthase component I
LDSAADPQKLGRFSFIGGDPFLIYRAKRVRTDRGACSARIQILKLAAGNGQRFAKPFVRNYCASPFQDLKRLMKCYFIKNEEYAGRPAPLLSGAVGYFGYDAGHFVEQLSDVGMDDLALPDIYLMFCDCILAHCHQTDKSYISVVGRGPSSFAARQAAETLRNKILSRIAAFETDPPSERPKPSARKISRTKLEVRAHFDESTYCQAVARVKEHIFAGDIFEACLTHRLESSLEGGEPWDLYQELRSVNPAPFACYLNFPEVQIVSASPERFIALDKNGIAESRPMKGTRPRGQSPPDDIRLSRELLHSAKDRAENAMIVDVVRNDFGRVCKFHTVHVPEFMTIESHATVFQMVSTIRGELRPDLVGLDLIAACFPGGSMTGAPKIEAMKIIDRSEPVKRGIYAGSIGYLDFAGSLDLNIVIRSFVIKDRRCYYHVGGAIVADSDPKAEYLETMDKARALMTALTSLKASAELGLN